MALSARRMELMMSSGAVLAACRNVRELEAVAAEAARRGRRMVSACATLQAAMVAGKQHGAKR